MHSSKSNPSSLNPRKFDEKIALLQASESEANEKFNRLLGELDVLKSRLSATDTARRTVSTPNVAGEGIGGFLPSNGGGGCPMSVSPAPSDSSSGAAVPSLSGVSAVPAVAGSAAAALLSPVHHAGLSSSSSSIPGLGFYGQNSPSPTSSSYALPPQQQQPPGSSTKHRVREYIISRARDHRAHPYSPTHQRSRDELYDETAAALPPPGPRRASSDTNIAESAAAVAAAVGNFSANAGSFMFVGQQQLSPPPNAYQQQQQLQQQQHFLYQHPAGGLGLQSDMTRLSLTSGAGAPNQRASWHHYQLTATQSVDNLSAGNLPQPQPPQGPIPDIRVTPIHSLQQQQQQLQQEQQLLQCQEMPPPPPPPPLASTAAAASAAAAAAYTDLMAAAQQHLENGYGVRRDSYTMATEVLASLGNSATAAGANRDLSVEEILSAGGAGGFGPLLRLNGEQLAQQQQQQQSMMSDGYSF